MVKVGFSNQLNPLSANPTKWANTLKQFVGNFSTNGLSVFDHFVGLALKVLTQVKLQKLSKSYFRPTWKFNFN